jgi:outer membrane protein
MTKKFALLVCVALSCFSVKAQDVASDSTQQQAVDSTVVKETIRFGYISYSEVLQAMPEYEKALADIDTIKAQYDKEVKISEAELNRRFTEYVEDQKSLPENILLKRQKEIQMLIEQSVQFRDEAQRLLAKAKDEIMQAVHRRLNEALAKVGKDRNYAFILNTDNNSCPFVNPEQGEDATDAVLFVLGIQ